MKKGLQVVDCVCVTHTIAHARANVRRRLCTAVKQTCNQTQPSNVGKSCKQMRKYDEDEKIKVLFAGAVCASIGGNLPDGKKCIAHAVGNLPDDKKYVAHCVDNLPDGKKHVAHCMGNPPDGKKCVAHAVGNHPDNEKYIVHCVGNLYI